MPLKKGAAVKSRYPYNKVVDGTSVPHFDQFIATTARQYELSLAAQNQTVLNWLANAYGMYRERHCNENWRAATSMGNDQSILEAQHHIAKRESTRCTQHQQRHSLRSVIGHYKDVKGCACFAIDITKTKAIVYVTKLTPGFAMAGLLKVHRVQNWAMALRRQF